MAVVSVKSTWIDDRGQVGDLASKVGRLGDDVRLFALHTLGWIRVQEVVRFREIEFDPRAARPAAVSALIDNVRSLSFIETPWLVRASAFSGKTWYTILCTDQESDRLLEWITAMAELGEEANVPNALEVSELPATVVKRDDDPVLRAIYGRWREHSGRLDLDSAQAVLPGAARPGSNVKVLLREASGNIVFSAYRASTTALWAPSTFGRFAGSRVVEAVPDRALAQRVVRSAVRTLAGGQPRAERFKGPCLRSDGSVEHLDWMRVSLPVVNAAGKAEAVIVFCRRMAEGIQHRISG